MALVDTHTHVVSPDRERYPLSPAGLPGGWYVDAPHSADELAALMDAHDVARAVIVQGVGAYSYDNRYAMDAVAERGDRFFGACCVDPHGPDPVGELERQHAAGARGVRLFALARPAPWLATEAGERLWRAAAERGMHVIVTLLSPQLPELEHALTHYPEAAVSLDHCAFPPLEAGIEAGLAPLVALARFPALHLKVSTHVLDASAEACGEPGAVVEALARAFGAERLMWGSDFCQTHDRPYGELVALGCRAFAGLASEERAQALGGTARKLWERAAASP